MTITKIGLRMSCLRWVIGEKRKFKEIGIVSKYLVDMLIKNRIYFMPFSKIQFRKFHKKSTLVR